MKRRDEDQKGAGDARKKKKGKNKQDHLDVVEEDTKQARSPTQDFLKELGV